MPHPVGGAMGVTLRHCSAARETGFDIISLNIHKTTSRVGPLAFAWLLYFDLDC